MSKAPPPIGADDAPPPAAPARKGRGRTPISNVCTDGEWREMVRRMRSCCPPPEGWAWKMYRSSAIGDDDLGDCGRQKNRVICVRVAFGMSPTETLDTLMHEMAHGYDMWTNHAWNDDEHGTTFWVWYGRIYRSYHNGYVA